MTDAYEPQPGDHFTFGLWTVGNRGRDTVRQRDRARRSIRSTRCTTSPSSAPTASTSTTTTSCRRARLAAEREQILKRFRRALDSTGMQGADGDDQPLLEPRVQGGRVHRQRSGRAPVGDHQDARRDRHGRRARCVDLRDVGRPRRHRVRRGEGRPARARPLQGGRRHLLRVRRATAATTCASRSSPSRTSRAATSCCRPSATRSRSSSGSSGPTMVGLNPEFAHETMSGLSFHHAVAQTLWSGKLFHIDLNGQVPSKYDQDFRFGSEGIRDAFYLVKLLEDAQWPGMRHFDAHAYRTEDDAGVWDFARGCIRTYLDPAREGAPLPHRRRDPGRACRPPWSTGWPSRRSPRSHPTRSPRCGAGRTTSTPWRRAATATSGSTSS